MKIYPHFTGKISKLCSYSTQTLDQRWSNPTTEGVCGGDGRKMFPIAGGMSLKDPLQGM